MPPSLDNGARCLVGALACGVALGVGGCAAAHAALPTVRVTGRWTAHRDATEARDVRSHDAQAGVVLAWSALPTDVRVDDGDVAPLPDAVAADCASDPLCAWTLAEACDAYARLEGADPRCPVSSP